MLLQYEKQLWMELFPIFNHLPYLIQRKELNLFHNPPVRVERAVEFCLECCKKLRWSPRSYIKILFEKFQAAFCAKLFFILSQSALFINLIRLHMASGSRR